MSETYDRIIGHLMAGHPELATEELGKISRPELDVMFERATTEQIAREDLREMILNRM